MTESITDRIRTCLFTSCGRRADDLIVAGVSGGIDSVFLLTQLNLMQQPIIAAVFDHGLRPEAAEECDFVEEYCAQLGIRCCRGKDDVSRYAAENGLGVEEAARELRYKFLFETAETHNADAVATAHHANDQAETVLLHLLRGSGTDGLCGMRPCSLPNTFSQTIPLIRPLLGITRAEIESYAAETGMPYREDASNRDNSYTRNRVRNDLLPKLAADYNPRITEALCRLAENAGEDKKVLDSLTETALDRAGLAFHDGGAKWNRAEYRAQPDGLRLRMLRMILARLDSRYTYIGYQNLKDADAFFLRSRFNQTIPFISLYLKCEGDKAKILHEPMQRNLQIYPQMREVPELSVETRSITPEELPDFKTEARLHPETAILDADRIVSHPYLRRIREGERFDPYGMNGKTQKLSDFLVNAKVPKEYRTDLAAAADEAGIIWIPGLRVSHRCALTDQTRNIMILQVKFPQVTATQQETAAKAGVS